MSSLLQSYFSSIRKLDSMITHTHNVTTTTTTIIITQQHCTSETCACIQMHRYKSTVAWRHGDAIVSCSPSMQSTTKMLVKIRVWNQRLASKLGPTWNLGPQSALIDHMPPIWFSSILLRSTIYMRHDPAHKHLTLVAGFRFDIALRKKNLTQIKPYVVSKLAPV